MNRREFSRRLGVGLAGGLLARRLPGVARAATARRPLNVLFLAADDLRGQSVGCLGDPAARTPHLDALAARGIAFTRAYCQQTICNPSRASLLTGRRPDTLKVWDLPTHFRDTHPDLVTLPQRFLRAGCFTQNVGKIYHNGDTRIHGDPASWSVPSQLFWANHTRDDHAQVAPGTPPSLPSLVASDDIRDVPDEAHLDGRVAATAIDALRAIAGRSQPFFFAAGFWKPHRPFNAPKKYWDLYPPGSVPPPRPSHAPIGAPAPALVSQYVDYVARVGEAPGAGDELRRGYCAAISYMDAQLGKVVLELERLGLAQNTLIVFWADHGYQQGEHAMWGKTSCFEYDARVPLLIVPPANWGFPQGARCESVVELLDVYPTLLELAGLPRDEGLEGKSLLPLLTHPSSVQDASALTQSPRPWQLRRTRLGAPTGDVMGYSLRSSRWRYTAWRDWDSGEAVAEELYDESADPEESRNLAREPALHATRRDCAARLEAQVGRRSPRELAA